MWRYRRPGFEALLLAELQRQQRCGQFCDTVLKTGGVSLPVHSCVVSALSPQLSAALTAKGGPPSSGARLLEFGALGAGTLLQLGALLYSGEMAGVGEQERRQAVSAAAQLGVHGLVEVKAGREDAGVQTDPPPRDRGPSLWAEPHGDAGTPAGFLDGGGAPVTPAAVAHGLPPDDPYLPSALLTHPAGGGHPSSPLTPPGERPATASLGGHTPCFISPPACPSDPAPPPHAAELQGGSWAELQGGSWAELQGGSWAELLATGQATPGEGEVFERFDDNILGFIHHFLNPGQEDPGGRSRGGRRRGRGRGGGGGTREGGRRRRAGRPRAKAPGKRRGAAPQQPAAAAETEAPAAPLLAPRRSRGTRVSRTGRGGGAAGRPPAPRTRDQTGPIRLRLERRGRSRVWQVSREDLQARRRRRRGPGGRRRSAAQQAPEEEVSVPAPPAVPPDPGPHVSPAGSLFHTAALPKPSYSPDDAAQSGPLDRFLEQFMMAIDLPDHRGHVGGAAAPPPPPAPSSGGGSGGQPSPTVAVTTQGEGPGARGVQSPASRAGHAQCEAPTALQAPLAEGEFHDIMDHVLRSFDLQIANCEAAGGGPGNAHTDPMGCRHGATRKPGPGQQRKRGQPRGAGGRGTRSAPAPAGADDPGGRVLRRRPRTPRPGPWLPSPLAGSSSTPRRGPRPARSPPVLNPDGGGEEPRGGSRSSRGRGSAVTLAVPGLQLNRSRPGPRTGKPFSNGRAMRRLLSAWSQARGAGAGGQKVTEKLRMVPVVSLKRSPLLQSYLDHHGCHGGDVKIPSSLDNIPLPSTPSSSRPVVSYPIRSRMREHHAVRAHAGQPSRPAVAQLTSPRPWPEVDEARPPGRDSSSAAAMPSRPQAAASCGGQPRDQTKRPGEKRHTEDQEPPIEAKRVCTNEGPIAPRVGTPDSRHVSCLTVEEEEEEERTVSEETEVIIDAVTVDLPQGAETHGSGLAPEPTCEAEERVSGEEEAWAGGRRGAAAQVKAPDADQEAGIAATPTDGGGGEDEPDREEETNVDGDDRDGDPAGTPADRRRGTPAAAPPPAPRSSPGKDGRPATQRKSFTGAAPSRPGPEVSLGSTGSWEEEEEEEEDDKEVEVDVIGGCSPPIPPPALRLARTLKPELKDAEDDGDEVEVVGGEDVCTARLTGDLIRSAAGKSRDRR